MRLSGQKVSKNDISIHFEGAADELNAHLGLVKAMILKEDTQTRQFIEKIQSNLVKLMAYMSSDGQNDEYLFTGDEIAALERETVKLSENIPQCFQLPGANVVEAQIHVARTVARRAERLLAAVNEKQPLSCPKFGAYLNELSNYLFALAAKYN
ncbi:MAG: ATP:cob(I)alamin adenosyltransferase [Chitinispirillales bacterium]|nr:ATP:cob(I)alamin adenosyltransferase [Chitinispirillales bacterium]